MLSVGVYSDATGNLISESLYFNPMYILPKLCELSLEANIDKLIWFAGERNDIADIMQNLDLFVLPSIKECISNTILKDMTTELSVIATDVGGNPELVIHNQTGYLVQKQNPTAMADRSL